VTDTAAEAGTERAGADQESAGPRPGRLTFGGRDPGTAAASAVASSTPTRCQARTRLYRDGVLKLQGFPVADISEYRRVVLPMREVVNSLMRRDLHLVDGPI
jgi:hypothetical protein